MRIGTTTLPVAIILLCLVGTACAESGLSYAETVRLISTTMASSTSAARKESYNYIRFDKCTLGYSVSGTYPVGEPYTIRFSGVDFSQLDLKGATAGHDYTAFVMLGFSKDFGYRPDTHEIRAHTAVVNVADDDGARTLLAAFRHLGELCGATQ